MNFAFILRFQKNESPKMRKKELFRSNRVDRSRKKNGQLKRGK